MHLKHLTVLAALIGAVALGVGITAAQSDVVTNGKHFFYAQGSNTPTPAQAASDIIYHGGNAGPGAVGVLTKPYAYIVLTPPRPIATGQPAYCGYHSQTTSIDGLGNPFRLQYAFIPWQNTDWPGLGQGCGLHAVNATSNSFGNGIFDSWSIVVGHEYEEAVTDPDNFFAVQDGWNDAQTSENSDKCAWTKLKNVKFGSHVFAVQPNWSNRDFDAGGDGCPTPY